MSTLKMNPELEQAIRAASSPEAIQSAIQAELAKQSGAAETEAAAQAAAAKAATDKAAAEAAAAGAGDGGQSFERTEVIGGKEFTFTGATQAEVDQMVLNAYRVASAFGTVEQTETQADPTPTADEIAAAQAAAEAETARQTELQLKFQRGEISIKTYLAESGVINDYLAEQGIPLAAMKESVQKVRDAEFVQSWEQATAAFLDVNGPGSDWPGGENNKINLQNTLASLNLTDAPDKLAALTQAYAYMKQHDMVIARQVQTDDSAAQAEAARVAAEKAAAEQVAASGVTPEAVAAAQTPEQIQALVAAAVKEALANKAAADAAAIEAAKKPRGSSSMFGASTGISSSTGVGAAETKVRSDAAAAQALKDMSPAEIIETWKQSQVAGGKDPNAAFLEQFSGRKA